MLKQHTMNGVKQRVLQSDSRGGAGSLFNGLSDEELVTLAKEKHKDAFPELLNRYYELILYKAAQIKLCGADTDDMMQEASLALLNAVETYSAEAGASFRTYAGVCIDNRFRSAVRNLARDKNKPLLHYLELSSYYRQKDGAEPADAGADPEAQVLISESVSELRQHMRALLSDREYNVFDKYLSGCSYEDIAKDLGISEKSVDNALSRVRRKLKNALPKE